MTVRIDELQLTIDVTELQRLPETSPAFEGIMLGPKPGRCSWDPGTCCCTHVTDLQ